MTRNVLINVGGGLGDHVTAEPAIRYLLEHKSDDTEVWVASHWPRVFAHLPVRSYMHNTLEPFGGGSFTMINTLPDRGTELWKAVCFFLCNMVDFHSFSLMQRQLPIADKEIRLAFSPEERASVLQLRGEKTDRDIALHAGKSWKTKTFPKEWWQTVAKGLSQKGARVILFGKSGSHVVGDATGLVDIDCPPGGLDLRDKLEIGEMFALLSECPVLLTNDSSPVQVAGAFDNWIAMVATIKEPSLVFPIRHGSPTYKTKALHRALLADEIFKRPLDLASVQVDIDVNDWSPYLPTPDSVVHETVSLLK